MDTLFAFANMYVYCQLGENSTSDCLKLADLMYDSPWYNLPATVQKNYILMIANMQQPLAFDGFYVVYLNLETFKKVRSI